MKTNWTLADYCELYNERAGIMEHCGGGIHNIVNGIAWNEVFTQFKQNECPNDDEIAEFRKVVSKRYS